MTLVMAAAASLLIGCEAGEEREARCIGPLVELVRWRDTVESDRILRGKVLVDLAAQETRQVDEAVAKLSPLRQSCELTWSLQLYPEADNPGLRLRNRALHTLLGLPAPNEPSVPAAPTPTASSDAPG